MTRANRTRTAEPATLTARNGSLRPLPKGWRHIKFGDVVRIVKDDVDPETAGLERYVAGEHMDSDNLRILRWGNIGEGYLGPAFHRLFRRGQVLYGSRRTYLKKVALADFDGICANTTLVLEAKASEVLPELLPFVMLSDGFTEHSVRNSKGSVNPYINWPDIANYQLILPPLKEQHRIVDILRSLEGAIESYSDALKGAHQLEASLSEQFINYAIAQSENRAGAWTKKPVSELCSRISVGIVVTPAKYYQQEGIRCFRSANVRRGYVEDADWVFISEAAHRQHSKSILRADDVLVVRSGVCAGMSCVVPPHHDGANCIDLVFATPDQQQLLPEWLAIYINSPIGKRQISIEERGLAQKHFGVAAMRDMQVPLPPVAEQRHRIDLVLRLRQSANAISEHIGVLRRLKRDLYDKLLVRPGVD